MCDLQEWTRGLDILRTFIISKEITHIHDLCKSLTMYSKLKFFYRLKIVSFTCHQPKDIINMEKTEVTEMDHGETVNGNRTMQSKLRSNRKAAVFDSYSI